MQSQAENQVINQGVKGVNQGEAAASTGQTFAVHAPLPWVRGLRLLAAKDDLRRYLNGVAITAGHLAATDGRRLGAMRHPAFDSVPELIIPNAAIDKLLLLAKAEKIPADGGHVVITYTPGKGPDEPATGKMVVCRGEAWGPCKEAVAELAFTAERGIYPCIANVLRTLPDEHKEHPQFNWDALALFNQVARALWPPLRKADSHAQVIYGAAMGTSKILIPAVPDFVGALGAYRV